MSRRPPRPTRRCWSASPIRIPARFISCASPRRNSPRSVRSPASPTSRIWSSTMCRERWLVESKSLKLYLGAFRNHGAFHEDCTRRDRQAARRRDRAAMAAHRRLLVSARRHADRRVLADRRAARRTCGCRTRASRPIGDGVSLSVSLNRRRSRPLAWLPRLTARARTCSRSASLWSGRAIPTPPR